MSLVCSRGVSLLLTSLLLLIEDYELFSETSPEFGVSVSVLL